MSIVTENQQRPTHTGSGIIFIIVAIAALASLAVGMSTMSRISTINQLQLNQANKSRNLALSGREYARGIAHKYKGTMRLNEFKTYLKSNATQNLGDDIGSFTISNLEIASDGTGVTATIEGKTPEGPHQAKYRLPELSGSVAIPYTPIDDPTKEDDEINTKLYAINSTANITLNRDNTITGSIYAAKNVTLNGGAVVDGNINAGGCVTFNQGTVTGNVCTTCSWASWSSSTEVDGNVVLFGNLTMNGGTYKGDVYVTGQLTVNGNATINGNIYAGSIYINRINLLGNAYAVETINSQGSQYFQNYTIKFPSSCDTPTVTPKDANIKYASQSLLIQNQNSYIFSAANNNDPTYNSIDFTQITLNNSNKTLYFDLSQGDINILVTGSVTFNQAFTIKISPDGTNWETYDPDNITTTMKKYAKRIYLESHQTISFNGATNWVGTLYGHGFNLNQNGHILGTIYSTADTTNANSGVDVMIMPSNFVDKWWTK